MFLYVGIVLYKKLYSFTIELQPKTICKNDFQ